MGSGCRPRLSKHEGTACRQAVCARPVLVDASDEVTRVAFQKHPKRNGS